MSKAAVLVLADTETHGDLGRVVNAMMTAKELSEAGDDVELLFDGAGTQWPGVLADEAHQSHKLFSQVHEVIRELAPSAPTRSSPKREYVGPTSLFSMSTRGTPACADCSKREARCSPSDQQAGMNRPSLGGYF